VTLQGFEELKRALTELPADLERQARRVVEDAADRVASQVRTEYAHVRTGDSKALSDHVRVDIAHDPGMARARVIVDLPYAASFEFGTQVRKRKGRRGSTGAAPAKPTLVPAARRARVTMRETLIELVKRQGLGVRDA
jgi:hypothetical protein